MSFFFLDQAWLAGLGPDASRRVLGPFEKISRKSGRHTWVDERFIRRLSAPLRAVAVRGEIGLGRVICGRDGC